jgi:mono/diheme cytochrome c family protein
MTRVKLLVGIVLVGAPFGLGQDAPKPKAKVATAALAPAEGDRLFQEHCARCHNAPEGFSSRISGTIVKHMRVRAGLSEHDAKELFRFFNP